MAAQPETQMERDYAKATALARRFLASRYPLGQCRSESVDYPRSAAGWREVWNVETAAVDASGEPLHMLLAIPPTFPDVFPRAFLTVSASSLAGRLPHVDRHRQICTFDSTTSQCNADHPGEIALQVLQRAESAYVAGVNGENSVDFSDEASAYWSDQDGMASALTLVKPEGDSRVISSIELRPAWRTFHWLFAEKQTDGERWLERVGYAGKAFARRAFYLPIADFGRPPYPSSNGELYARLKHSDPAALAKIIDFLRTELRPSRILANIPAPGGSVLVAWEHPPFTRTVMRSTGPTRVSGAMPGFRPSHQPPEIELSDINARATLLRASVAEIYPTRLLRRSAGPSLDAPLPRAVNVIGCGSLGGFLAEGLARSGLTDRLRLVDSETLGVENPARHYCGMADVGMAKSTAVARRIESHFPHVRCDPHVGDILEIVRMKPGALSPASLTVVALGNFAAERRLNRLLHEREGAPFSYPACFVWAEPFLYGGHVLYLADGSGCFECLFDDQFRFQHRVVSDPSRFIAREAGCQTSYVPYGGTDVTSFVAASVRFIASSLDQSQNRLFTWTGDLDAARASGISLQPGYQSRPSYGQAACQPIISAPDCPVCVPL